MSPIPLKCHLEHVEIVDILDNELCLIPRRPFHFGIMNFKENLIKETGPVHFLHKIQGVT